MSLMIRSKLQKSLKLTVSIFIAPSMFKKHNIYIIASVFTYMGLVVNSSLVCSKYNHLGVPQCSAMGKSFSSSSGVILHTRSWTICQNLIAPGDLCSMHMATIYKHVFDAIM